MLKELLNKTTKNVYEIHCLKIDDLHNDQSVIGSVSGGKRSTKGSTYTLHKTVVNANNRLYKDVQKNGSYPFKVGDKMAFTCYERKDGIWKIDSLINFTNNSNTIISKFFSYLFFCPLAQLLMLVAAIIVGLIVSIPIQASNDDNIATWISAGLILCVILAYIAFFFWLPYYLYHDYKNHKRAMQVLRDLATIKSEEEIKNCLANYPGKSSIAENFFSN